MFGFLIALVLAGIKKLVDEKILIEQVVVESAGLLWWWYISTGLVIVSLATLAWAGDLGTEGARLRHGIVTPLSWMMGVPRVPLRHKSVLLFLILRRLLLVVSASLLTQGLRAVGATFVWDERLLWTGGIALGVGLLMGVLMPLLRKVGASVREGISV